MKKLLSILLVISTLFLSIGLQTCFASNQEVKTQKVEKLLTELKERDAKLDLKLEEKEQKPSWFSNFYCGCKNLFKKCVKFTAVEISLFGIILGFWGVTSAGYNCYNDNKCATAESIHCYAECLLNVGCRSDECKLLVAEKGHRFIDYLLNFEYGKAFAYTFPLFCILRANFTWLLSL